MQNNNALYSDYWQKCEQNKERRERNRKKQQKNGHTFTHKDKYKEKKTNQRNLKTRMCDVPEYLFVCM